MNPEKLSTKMQASYAELAREYLESIPIRTEEEARFAAASLRALSSSSDRALAPPSLEGGVKQITEQVEAVKELLDNPDMYAAPEHIEDFKKIIQAKIAGKISEFESLSPDGIRKSHERQEYKRQSAAAYKQRISDRAPPPEGSEAHVVSEEEALREHWGAMGVAFERGAEWVAALKRIREDASAIESVSDALRNDRDFILEAVRVNGLALRHASADLRDDRDFVLEAAQVNSLALGGASDALRNDRDFVLEAVRVNGRAFGGASDALRNDRNVALEAVRANGPALWGASEALRNDRNFVLEAVRVSGRALWAASDDLKNDREIVLAAIRQNALAFRAAGANLRNDREVVLVAVRVNGLALGDVNEALRDDREIVLAAVRQDGRALRAAARSERRPGDRP